MALSGRSSATEHTALPTALKAVRRVLGWPDEQLAQDIATDLLPKLPPPPFEGWVYRAAYRRCLREAARRNRFTPDIPERAGPWRFDALLDAERALEKLHPRAVGILFFRLQGYRFKEIADMIGCSTNAATLTLARELRRLQEVQR